MRLETIIFKTMSLFLCLWTFTKFCQKLFFQTLFLSEMKNERNEPSMVSIFRHIQELVDIWKKDKWSIFQKCMYNFFRATLLNRSEKKSFGFLHNTKITMLESRFSYENHWIFFCTFVVLLLIYQNPTPVNLYSESLTDQSFLINKISAYIYTYIYFLILHFSMQKRTRSITIRQYSYYRLRAFCGRRKAVCDFLDDYIFPLTSDASEQLSQSIEDPSSNVAAAQTIKWGVALYLQKNSQFFYAVK